MNLDSTTKLGTLITTSLTDEERRVNHVTENDAKKHLRWLHITSERFTEAVWFPHPSVLIPHPRLAWRGEDA